MGHSYKTDPVQKIGPGRPSAVYTGSFRNQSEKDPSGSKNWTCFFAGPLLDPFESILDQFQTVPLTLSRLGGGGFWTLRQL